MEQTGILNSKQVRRLCGNVTDMTLFRWINDETLNFPKPRYVRGRRYWRAEDVYAWIEREAVA